MLFAKKSPQLLGTPRDADSAMRRYWQAFLFCALTATFVFLPFYIVDGGYFHYAGDFNSQQISFYRYMNAFVKEGGMFSWETDLGSGALNAYSFYLSGSPFFWLSLLFPQSWLPYLMCPLLVLKFAVAGGGAYLYLRPYVKDQNYAVIGACLYAFSGFTVYNVFFNHFVDVVALFPYLLWALDAAIDKNTHGWFCIFVALNFINNYFFFVGQVLFVCIYFVCKLSARQYRLTKKVFLHLAIETLLGAGMGAVLAWPAFLSLLQNPRTIDFSSGYGFLMYSKVQQYFAILLSWVLPPDSPYLTSLWSEGIVKWTSMTAYLPLCSIVCVVVYCKTHTATWIQRVLFTCAVCALVPALNSAFYAMNSSYYARWYYMPVLIMVLATVIVLEDCELSFHSTTVKVGLLMLSTLAFAFVPVYDSAKDLWSFGVLQNAGQYLAVLFLGVSGLALFFWVNEYWRGTAVYPRRLLAVLLAFSCVYSVVHIGIGKFGQWDGDKNLSAEYLAAARLKESMPEGNYRVDTYECQDNLGLWVGKSNLQYFGSTVAPSILEFYPRVGVKRDVSSKPELSDYALRGLLGVQYLIMPAEKEQDFLEIDAQGYERSMEAEGYVLYQNQNYLPMGYCYDYYLTEEQYSAVSKTRRSNLLMRGIVLSEEQIEQLAQGVGEDAQPFALAPIPQERLSNLSYDEYQQDIAERGSMACTEVQTTVDGLTASITLPKANLVFFAVPYDDGFSATVNGTPADVWKVDSGLLAVPCPEGQNQIVLTYQPDGFAQSSALALACLVLFCVYLVAVRVQKRKQYHC